MKIIAIIILLILVLSCGNNPTKVVIKGLDDEVNEETTIAPQKPTSSELEKTTVLFLIKNDQNVQDAELFALDLKEIYLKSKGITLKIIPEEKKPDLIELNKYNTAKLLSMSKITEGDYDEISFNINEILYKKTGDDSKTLSSKTLSIPIKTHISPKENYAFVLNYLAKDSLKQTTDGLAINHKAELIAYKGVNVVINSDRTAELNNAQEVFKTQI